MSDPGHRAEADNHLLVHDQDGDEEEQDPQQAGVIVLAGLSVGRHPTGVVVADHDDEAGVGNGGEREQAFPPAVVFANVPDRDPPEGALDVAQVGLVEDGGRRGLELRAGAHLWAW